MPQKRNRAAPADAMTWGRAAPFLAIAVIFDGLRFMFEWFVFFAPAFAAIFCTAAVGSAVGTTIGVGLVCSAGAIAAGAVASAPIEAFGIVMAMVTGFAGWLAVGILLSLFNSRIFKENVLWFAVSLLVIEIPFVGSLPAITIILWRMYANQIRIERAAMKKFREETSLETHQAAIIGQQIRTMQAANDAAYAGAANDEMEEEETRPSAAHVTNDEDYGEIPEKAKRAA